jgi:hypothetical protein
MKIVRYRIEYNITGLAVLADLQTGFTAVKLLNEMPGSVNF